MPTDKRQRQREGREARREAARRAQQRAARRRQVIGGLVLILVIALIGLLVSQGGGDDEGAAATTTTSADGSTTTGAAAVGAAECPPADGSAERRTNFDGPPRMCIDPARSYSAEVETDAGSFTIDLDPGKAPIAVNNFVFLARYRYYENVPFHRVIPGFVVQGGDGEKGDGTGGPGYTIEDEPPQQGEYRIGSVAMAKTAAPDSAGSQFFVVTGDRGVALPPEYTLFGTVSEGLDVVRRIESDGTESGTPKVKHGITKVTIEER